MFVTELELYSIVCKLGSILIILIVMGIDFSSLNGNGPNGNGSSSSGTDDLRICGIYHSTDGVCLSEL